jgi:hypothetical protein
MKKIFVVLAMLAVTSCSSYLKGDYSLGRRNTFNDFFWTYNIHYYDKAEEATVEIKTETVNNFQVGELRRAVPGGLVISSKNIRKQIFSDEYVRPTKPGELVSYTVPVSFSDEKTYRAIGESEINGKVYRLLEPNRLGDVILIDEEGKIYKRVGKIYNNRLALLQTAFLVEPEDVKFVTDVQENVTGEDAVSGFEIRYTGLEDYYMVFSYTDISSANGLEQQDKKTYKFPMYDKKITIDGIDFEIISVNETGIEYRVTKF